jgi:hypothetical protein
MKFEIKSRWTGNVLFSLECDSWKVCVEAAVKSRADLRGADLSDAVLSGADLRDADLRDADLSGADLRGADLRDADLRDAVLSGAVLSGADLSGADLRDADLSDADLRDADLRDADLSRAVLTPIRDDIWAVLSSLPAEVPALIKALKAGRVDGSTYTGECSCLVGTLAAARGADVENLGSLKINASRPAERFFMGIRKGDTPETNQFSKLALEWSEQWLANMRAAFSNNDDLVRALLHSFAVLDQLSSSTNNLNGGVGEKGFERICAAANMAEDALKAVGVYTGQGGAAALAKACAAP